MNILYDMLDHGAAYNSPSRIVVHSMGEQIDDGDKVYSARDWLDYLGFSAHILVKPDGDLIRCRVDNTGAYHARGYNSNSLGIEFLVKGRHNYTTFLRKIKKDWVTKEQYRSGARIIGGWMNEHNINLTEVNRHSDLSPGRKVDPGEGMDFDNLMRMANDG